MGGVYNKRTYRGASGVYIARCSDWSNPFRIGVDGDRADVITKHERWLADSTSLLRRLDELRGRDLVCYRAGDPAALAEALGEALALGASSRDALGLRARRHAEERFGLERSTRETLDAYAGLLET